MSKAFGLRRFGTIILAAATFGCVGSVPAYAGGVSDGGGGTTNPHPADPQWVVSTASETAAKALLLWLNSEEGNFRLMSASQQAESPMRKIFSGEKSIFETVRNTAIEVRMYEPCYDKNGAPWDGSIYTTKPGAICISPFTMAPKLNVMNVESETAALILHELSHLHGTTEDEARAIQQQALYALGHMDFIDLATKLGLFANHSSDGRIPMIMFDVQALLATPNERKESDVSRIVSEMGALRSDTRFQFLRAQALREATVEAFNPSFCGSRSCEKASVLPTPRKMRTRAEIARNGSTWSSTENLWRPHMKSTSAGFQAPIWAPDRSTMPS